jgi:hypothetical protein
VRQTMTGGIVAGVLLVAGTARAQSPATLLDTTWRGVVPVTGPSTMGLTEPPKPEVIHVVVKGDPKNGQNGRPGAPSAASATAAHPAPPVVKAAHKPTAKTTKKATVKKASTPKYVARGAGTSKTRHVAAAKPAPAGHHAAVSKPIPLTKSQTPAKGSAPTQPVLPRV